MASEEAIAEVLSNLPDDSGWDNATAAAALDTFGSVARACRSYWSKRSSGPGDVEALTQIAHYDGIIAAENAEQAAPIARFIERRAG